MSSGVFKTSLTILRSLDHSLLILPCEKASIDRKCINSYIFKVMLSSYSAAIISTFNFFVYFFLHQFAVVPKYSLNSWNY